MNLGKSFQLNGQYRVCNFCVMDTTDPDIIFDDDGNCNNCRSYLQKNRTRLYQPGASEKSWLSYVDQIKSNSRGRKYDCIVGVSGGVDSSYVAYLCKSYNLRVLLVHLDNGWNTEIAARNIKALVDSLGFEYYCHVIDWDEFRRVQTAFLSAMSVDLEMATDIAIHALLFETANKFDVKYIISGGNLSSEGMLHLTWGYHRYKDMRMYRHIVKKYGATKLKNTPHIGIIRESYLRIIRRIKTLYILNYHDYNKDEAKNFLIEKMNWKDYGGKHHESRITAFWHGYVMLNKFGLDYRKPTLSAQICNGQISRSAALKILDTSAVEYKSSNEEFEFIAGKLGISPTDLCLKLNQETKCYKDFPNNKIMIDFLYDVYNRYFNRSRV